MIRGLFWRVAMPVVIVVGTLVMIGTWFLDLTQPGGVEQERRKRGRKWKK